MVCKCPTPRTDGLPPCETFKGHKRPDGYYCDCGHAVGCHPQGRTIETDVWPEPPR